MFRQFPDYTGMTEEELDLEKLNIMIEKRNLLAQIVELDDQLVAISEVRYQRKNKPPEVAFYDLED